MVKNIYLLGFMGSGKSTVGPLLARKMERSFYDLDVLIEKKQNMRVSEIFESKGESFFRILESRVLAQSENLPKCVVALGGGTFISKSNRDYISKQGISVWLKIPFEMARGRCKNLPHRPLARDPQQFESLFRQRECHYRLATLHVEVQGKSPKQISAEIETMVLPLI